MVGFKHIKSKRSVKSSSQSVKKNTALSIFERTTNMDINPDQYNTTITAILRKNGGDIKCLLNCPICSVKTVYGFPYLRLNYCYQHDPMRVRTIVKPKPIVLKHKVRKIHDDLVYSSDSSDSSDSSNGDSVKSEYVISSVKDKEMIELSDSSDSSEDEEEKVEHGCGEIILPHKMKNLSRITVRNDNCQYVKKSILRSRGERNLQKLYETHLIKNTRESPLRNLSLSTLKIK